MIKAGTRVSNPKGNPNSGFEFVRDVHYDEAWSYDKVLKPYGKAKRWGKKGIPNWLSDEVEKLMILSESEPETPSDYAWSEHIIPVVYKRDLGDRIYSIEDDENLYHVQLATLSDGEYFMCNILTTRWLWIARAYVRLHGWLA